MRPRRCQLPLGTGRSLTRRDLVDRAGRVDRDPVDPGLAVLDPVDPDRADLADPVEVVRHLADLAVPAHTRDPVGLDPAARVGLDPAGPADPVDLHPVDRAVPADIKGRVDPVDLVGLGLAGRVDLVDQGMNRAARVGLDPAGRAVPVDQGMNRVGLVGPADLVAPADRADLVIRADRHRRRTNREARLTAVAPRWAGRGMCRTASAHPGMVRRLRRQNADGVGMAGLRRERRRLGGMDRRPRVVGTVHHLPVVGMSDGMGRTATKAGGSVISGRSTTTGSARFRCSTRCSGDGASGSSGSGFRCTDLTRNSSGLRTLLMQVRRP